MQQPGPMFPVMPSFPPTNITTEQIQKYLDENKKLILAILDNQNLGKLAECAQYQAQLQKNLMYLAAIADAQPQTPAIPTQMSPHPAIQQGGFYMQHPQAAAAMAQQQGMFPPRAPFNNPHALQDPQQHQPQGQMALRSVGPTNGVNPPHNDTSLGGGNSSVPTSNSGLSDIRGGNKQDKPDGGGAASSDGKGSSAAVVHGGGDGEEAK
ncbi:Calcium-responsive transcription coactivator [Handroanthus impetiginosus]|uniref:Calcium-responsive transcription coactivator n=1 Tax=Handroanthus impetiginosus TaxID=429701 RepID=A0A2G9H7Q9_9LAMI|nr:Calcium-responsive transcription coactivator [Handroanthus impetiginosus]